MAANINDKFTEATNGTRPVPTTLTSLKSIGAASISCGALTGWPTATAVHFIIYTTDVNGNKVAGSQTDWKGIVSGTTITGLVLKAGTDNGYAVGAVVQASPTAAWADDLTEGLAVEHNQDGTHNTAALATIISGLNTQIWPVGSIYINAAVSTNPGTLLGFGTWVAFGEGRVPIGVGTGTYVDTQAAANYNVSNIITVTSNDTFYTGQAVVLTTSGVAPTGLTAGNTYYVIRLSATTISLATTRALAVAGTAIDITGTGSGNHTLTVTLTARALNDVGGEENHSLTTTELPAHTHTVDSRDTDDAGTNGVIRGNGASVFVTSTATGGNTAHNIMQPYIAVYMWRRTA